MPDTSNRRVPLAFWFLAGALFPVMVYSSFSFGATWDEKVQHEYGELVYRYFASGFTDRSALSFKDLYLYGGLFDWLCVVATKLSAADPSVLRHLVNSVFGWIGVLYTGRLATLLFGSRAGLIAMILLAASPRYFGDAMNNPKDIPFAAMAVIATYYLARADGRYPYFTWKTATKVAIAIALTINMRAGGILFLCYLAAQLLFFIIKERDFDPRHLAATGGRFAAIALASLVFGTLFWPWGQQQPLVRPFQALSALTNFRWPGSVLYAGRYLPATSLPWNYGLTLLWLTTPPVVLAGLALSFGQLRKGAAAAMRAGACWFLVLFPVGYVILRHSTLYDGVRHLLFVYPLMVVIAAAGWSVAIGRGAWRRAAVALLLAIGLVEPLWFQWQNAPNQIVYFNLFAGGPNGAMGRYDLDYWGSSMLPAVEVASRMASGASGPLLVSSGEPNDVAQIDLRRFGNLVYSPLSDGNAHLHIELLRGNADHLRAILRIPALATIRTADGAPLCVIQPGPRYGELQVLPPAGPVQVRYNSRLPMAPVAQADRAPAF